MAPDGHDGIGVIVAGTVPLVTALTELAVRRPVFHSEADFQHELAWQLRTAAPTLSVRLEIPLILEPTSGKRERLDLLISSPSGARTAIELKYCTDRLDTTVNGERFNLARRAAQDISTYDIVKDIGRIERFIAVGEADSGAVVLLANDPWYWKPPISPRVTGAGQFRVHEGAVLAGDRVWQVGSGPGTQRGREMPISLSGSHVCHWVDYSRVDGHLFRVLTIAVPPESAFQK